MLRKQYHLSAQHVRRIETLRTELGLGSDAEVIRRAIDTFDTDALDSNQRDMVETTVAELLSRIEQLNKRIDETIEQTRIARERLADPQWIESVRERTRRETEADPDLVAGVTEIME